VENRGRALTAAGRVRRAAALGLVAGCVLAAVRSAGAEPLDRLIPNLFGGTLSTSLSSQVTDTSPDVQRLQLAERFRGLSAALAPARSQAPVPSASGAFRFSWDPELDTFVRERYSLGPLLAERAQTLGRHTGIVSAAYSHVEFSTLDGDRLSGLQASQNALSPTFVAQLPPEDQINAGSDVLRTSLNFAMTLDEVFLTAAYGLTDSIDVSLALSLNQVHMQGAAAADILHNPNLPGGACFAANQPGVILSGSGSCFRSARDSFSATAVGTGDLYLRGKWHLYDSSIADLAVAGVLTLPTGNADDLLGFHDPTFTPWLIASKTFGRVSPHLNLGYAFRGGQDVSQAEWIAGADVRTFDWLTLAADFLGYHDDKRDGVNDDVLQSAVGFKFNPFGEVVIAGGFQFPLNRDGLRADVIYTGQIEYTF